MPITQLMQKLSSRRDRREAGPSAVADLEPRRSAGASMECGSCFEVVAEVSLGSQAGSMCSLSSAGSVTQEEPDHPQQLPSHGDRTARASSSSAALLASSLSGPLLSMASSGSNPATSRALRARGKAILRTESGLAPGATTSCSPSELDLQHQLSLDSSSSMTDAFVSSSLPYGSASGSYQQLASPTTFMRSSTAPLPNSLRAAGPGSLSAALAGSQQEAGAGCSSSKCAALDNGRLPSAPAAGGGHGGPGVAEVEEHEEGDEELVAPVSPAAAAAGDGDCHEHCHWEDGVIAGWLQGIDHSELLHAGEDDEEAAPQPPAAAPAATDACCSKSAVAAAGAFPCSSMPSNPNVFSSLLYN